MISRSPGRVSLVLWIYAPTLCQCLGNRAKSRHILGVLAILSQEQKTNLYALRREYGILLTPLNHVQVVYHVHLTPNKKYTPPVNGVFDKDILLICKVAHICFLIGRITAPHATCSESTVPN